MHTVYTSTKTNTKVLVIGGGAAGMMAAIFAARNGADVTLLEKNEKLGKKIYITGKGRCNLTNDCTLDEFMACVPRNPRFLYASLNQLSPQDTMALVEEMGTPVKVERGRRAFPVSEKASDVTKALKHAMDKAGAKVLMHSEVAEILTENEKATGVMLCDGRIIKADAVIVATGGLSYPSTGSTGDGYAFAMNTGHVVTTRFPSLTGFDTKEEWIRALQGLSLKNVSLTAMLGNKKIYHQIGEMLFTHFGISGPLVIELSSLICDRNVRDYNVTIDLKPGLTTEQLEARFIREFSESGKKKLSNIIMGCLPQRLAAVFSSIANVDENKTASQISASERQRLVHTMKNLPVTLLSTRSFSEAIVTRGGVSVKDVNASTMESKRMKGLYFAGEVLDVDAFTGGYNLQIAFSTGALAGISAAYQE